MALPIAALLPIVTKYAPMLINTVTSVVRDKKAKKKANIADSTQPIDGAEQPNTELINEDVASGVSISSTRLLNVVGTPSLIGLGVDQLTSGNDKVGLILIGLGVVYCLGLTFLTKYSEK